MAVGDLREICTLQPQAATLATECTYQFKEYGCLQHWTTAAQRLSRGTHFADRLSGPYSSFARPEAYQQRLMAHGLAHDRWRMHCTRLGLIQLLLGLYKESSIASDVLLALWYVQSALHADGTLNYSTCCQYGSLSTR